MKKNEPTGPHISAVILLGLLTFLLGGALGLASLISKPVQELSRAPDPEKIEPGTVYYVKGDRLGRTAWRAKEEAWQEALVQALSLNEAELNQWSQERLKVEEPETTETESSWTDRLQVKAEPVNFRLLDGAVQLATELRMEGLFPGKTFHYQVVGHFQETPQGVRFIPDEGTLGNAALGNIPVVKTWLLNYVAGRYQKSLDLGWLEETLGNLQAVEVTPEQLTLRRQGQG